ncbi:hypothetical protein BGW41_008164 [Actinomortierella wolfii]|nr:hypothetical protein BGW41_008164 [Actinomortierella wolfii]
MHTTSSSSPRVAIITGANTGVGYAIAQRLALQCPHDITIILACRNKAKATEAQEKLTKEYKRAVDKKKGDASAAKKRVEFVVELVDVGRARSVVAFNARIQQQYRRIDYLFCNAGILPSEGIQYGKLIKDSFTDPLNLVISSDVLIQPKQTPTEDGVANVFACNVFGHYLMIKGLEEQLNKTAEDPGRVIWTGSMTPSIHEYDPQDFQGFESKVPYESSKWATNLLGIRLNAEWKGNSQKDEKSTTDEPRRLTRSQSRAAMAATPVTKQPKNIVSVVTDPGVVASNMGDLAIWLVWSRILLHYFVRIFFGESSQNIWAKHGANAGVTAALKEPVSEIDHYSKMCSRVDRLGREFVSVQRIDDYEDADGSAFVEKIEQLRQKVLNKVEQASS